MFVVHDGIAIFDFPGGRLQPALVLLAEARNVGFGKVPRALEEEAVVVVQGGHRVHAEVDLHHARPGLEAHRQRAVRAEAVALDPRRRAVRPRQFDYLFEGKL